MNKAPEQFNDYVERVENDWMVDIEKEIELAHRAAEGCGCRNCQLYYEELVRQHEEESWRLMFAPVMDHEERSLMNYALDVLQRRRDNIQ